MNAAIRKVLRMAAFFVAKKGCVEIDWVCSNSNRKGLKRRVKWLHFYAYMRIKKQMKD